MATYRYLACDLTTGNVRLEVPLVQVSAGRQLNSPGAFRASMPLAGLRNLDGTPNIGLQKACYDATEAKRSTIVVVRDGVAMGEWRITGRPSRKNDGSPVQLEGEYITGYFSEVIPSFTGLSGDLPAGGYPGPTSPTPGPGTDQLLIAWDLAAQCADPITSTTAPPGSRGLAMAMPARGAHLSGVLLTETDWATQTNTVAAMTQTIQQLAPGFDWDIDVGLNGDGTQVMRTWSVSYPQRGLDAGVIVLQPEQGGQGGQITDFNASEDGSLLATQIIGMGAGQPAIVARSNNTGLVAAFPLMQKVVSESATTDPNMLQAQANAAALNAQTALVPPELTLLADGYPQLGSYSEGDYLTVQIGPSPNFPYGYQQKVRITGFVIAPPVAGDEFVVLTVANIPTQQPAIT